MYRYNPVCPLLTDVRELYLRSYYARPRYEAMRQGAVCPPEKVIDRSGVWPLQFPISRLAKGEKRVFL